MTAPESHASSVAAAAAGAAESAASWRVRLEALSDRGSEKLNPILIKEARQSLKSRQFVVTFFLVLLFSLGWTLMGVAMSWPGIRYAPGGAMMMAGYFCVLAFPLTVIVPFAAFRSLAAEREDGTYELLSITALAPRQIIGGKLGSAVVQMLVHLSVLTPCLAFTYLLRGIDILTILTCVFYTFLASLLLSALGLLAATVAQSRQVQVVISVILTIGLLIAFYTVCRAGVGVVVAGRGLPFDDPDFWVGQLVYLTFYCSTVALFYLAAAARVSPSSENRSTRLRACMLVQHLLLIGWSTYYYVAFKGLNLLFTFMMLAMLYWYVMGAFMTGETPILSRRVRRTLPQSTLGRSLLTWFNPGPGTGYLFAVINAISAALFVVLAAVSIQPLGASGADREKVLWFAWIGSSYVAIYLGLGRLVILLVRRVQRCGLFLGFLLHACLLLLGVAAPLIAQWMVLYESNYTPLQITNPFWTLLETAEGKILSQGPLWATSLPVVPTPVFAAAAVVLLANIASAAAEVRHVRTPTPERIRADDLALHPEKIKPPPPASPWDE